MVFEGLGQQDRVAEIEKDVYETRVRVLGPSDPVTLQTLFTYGVVLRELGNTEESIKALQSCAELRQKAFGTNDPVVIECRQMISVMLMQLGHAGEAEFGLKSAWEVCIISSRLCYLLSM